MDDFKFEVMECSVEMYAEFIDEIDMAFNYKPGWFIKHLGHVLPTPEDVRHKDSAKNLIAVHEGKIIGATGFYPMDITASDGNENVTFKLGGVGQVSCLKEYRSRGVMSGLLNAGISRMKESGLEISWLSGLRTRYANFGYDLGGCEVLFQILVRDIKSLEKAGEGKEYIATDDDIEALDSMYRRIPARIERDKELWLRHIRRENLLWKIRELDGKIGYICYDAIDDGGIWEVAGDASCVIALLARFMGEHKKDYVMVKYPNCHDSLSVALYEVANGVRLEPNGQFSVLDSHVVYEKLLPFVKRQCNLQKNAETLIDRLNTTQKTMVDSIISKMIGFTYGPQTDGFEFLRPLSFFIPKPDEV